MLAGGNGPFINVFVTHMSTVVITDTQSEADFKMIVDAIVGFCVDNLSRNERATLGDKLQDPSLTFASPLAGGWFQKSSARCSTERGAPGPAHRAVCF